MNLYDLSFFSFIEYNQIYFINKFSGKTFNFNFLLPNEGKEYTIIRNNIIELLNPINLSEKLINEKKDKDTYMSS